MTFTDICNRAASYEDFAHLPDVSEYSLEIEDASEDRLRSWVLEHGVTDTDIEDSIEQGITIQDMAQDLVDQGYTLTAELVS